MQRKWMRNCDWMKFSHLPLSNKLRKSRKNSIKMQHSKKKLVRKLSSYGGVNGMKTIRTICKCIFTDPLLAEHSWLGTNAKKSFSQYKFLYKTILEAVRSRYPTYSEAEGASFFKGFLKQAPFRMGKPSTNTSSNTSSSASDGQSTT
ncbi:uncharacterized protein LOC129916506 [Episyrphus balteatus]|uniref:uncharacterized protein LOC129916506 n=1 Tax=Episyrphus balteatus TaxID=286459 RepID=UPI0024857BDA|nr:uncharacterized protein LOC129916506 [Episyrphus balteatus]